MLARSSALALQATSVQVLQMPLVEAAAGSLAKLEEEEWFWTTEDL
jgi:hypothetical protein